MAIYNQNPIRIAGVLVSQPAIPAVDANTGRTPQFWRAQNVGIYFAAFDQFGAPIDCSNVNSFTLLIQDGPNALFPLVQKVVESADITPAITTENWKAGRAWNALFSLTAAETDIALGGEDSKTLTLVIVANTDTGPIYYCGSDIIVSNAGGFPLPPWGYVSRNEQSLDLGDITIQPTSLDHTEIVTVGGAARTSNVILSVVGITDGALCRVFWDLPATADIVLVTKNATVSGDTLQTITSGIFATGLDTYCFTEETATWKRIQSQFPALP